MGQYFLIANTEKKEYISPHDLGSGAKMAEIMGTPRVGAFLMFLLGNSDGKGGGDLQSNDRERPKHQSEMDYFGHWANNRIEIIGDYDSSQKYDKIRNEYTKVPQSAIEEYNSTRFAEYDGYSI